MSELIDTTEMYLKTVFELIEEGVSPKRARITERLNQSGPTVSQTVARMERYGLLTVGDDRIIYLTDHGWSLAVSVMRKHRLVELLLQNIIGLDLAEIHEEACRWEHVVSNSVEQRLVDILPDPTISPYGVPVPGLAELRSGQAIGRFDARSIFWGDSKPLADLELSSPVGVKISKFTELLQTDSSVIADFVSANILPGALVEASRAGELFSLKIDGKICDVDASVAAGVFVEEVS